MREDIAYLATKIGMPTQTYAVSEQTLDKYKDIMPPRLLDIWQQEGFCQFEDGLYSIINPDDWQDIVDVWLAGTEFAALGKFYALARTGFGDIQAFHPQTCTKVKIRTIEGIVSGTMTNRTTAKEKDMAIEDFFLSANREFVDFFIGENETPLFKTARKKLGGLDRYEMYAFEPAYRLLETMQMLPTGDNLIKVDARDHMMMLRDIIDEPTVWVFDSAEILRLANLYK